MAIGFNLLTSGENGSSSVTTASVTVATNSLVVVVAASRCSSNPAADNQTTVAGLGLTWVRGLDLHIGNRVGSMFYSMGTGASGTIAIGGAGIVGFAWAVVEITGVVTTGTNGAGAVNNAAPLDSSVITLNGPQPSVTIAGTPSAGDVTFAALCVEDGETEVEEGGWTNVVHVAGTIDNAVDIMYSTGQDQTASWTGCRTDGRGAVSIGALLKAAAGASPIIPNSNEAVTIAESLSPSVLNMPKVFNFQGVKDLWEKEKNIWTRQPTIYRPA